MITWGKCFDLISNSLNLLLKECIKINMENCTRTLGLGGLRGMDLTRYGVCKINLVIEQKPAACCVVFKSNLPLPKDYILLRRFPQKT